ncbi:MAG: hypothetical protein MI922_07720 [Bacteroidales bacterium]|nr:hypothetical protein [Bacteroidales bacterium]
MKKNLSFLFLIGLSFVMTYGAQKDAFLSNIELNTGDNGNLTLANSDFDKFQLGFGFGFGFFYPMDVNDYLQDKYSSYETTNLEIYANFLARFSLNYRPVKFFSVEVPFELATAPKFVVADDEIDVYNLGRNSIGMVANLNLPIGSGRHYFKFGAGPMYHNMKFDGYKASALGVRANLFGACFTFGKFKPNVTVFYDYAKDNVHTRPVASDLSGSATINELSYTSGGVMINLMW